MASGRDIASKPKLRRRLRLRQLELLAALDHAPTLSAAAREVRLSQPVASKLLSTLADDLAVTLFERSGRTLRPTPAGRALVRHAAGLIGNLDRAQIEIDAIGKGLTGLVAVGAGIGACYVLMPAALSALLDQAPDISVTMREGPMEEMFAMLRDGRLDMVVGRVESNILDDEFLLTPLYDPPIHVIARPQHPLARKPRVTWDDLLAQDWIMPLAGTPMRSSLETMFRRLRRRPVRSFVESSSIQTNVMLLGNRDLLWVLSADIANYFARLDVLTSLPIPNLRSQASLSVVQMRDRTLSPSAARFVTCLRSAAKTIVASFQKPVR